MTLVLVILCLYIFLVVLIVSVGSFLVNLLNLVLISQTEGSTIPECPSILCVCFFFLRRMIPDQKFLQNSSLYLMFKCVSYLCRDWFCGFWGILRFDEFLVEWIGGGFTFVFCPDIILCGWLGSKHQRSDCFTLQWLITTCTMHMFPCLQHASQ